MYFARTQRNLSGHSAPHGSQRSEVPIIIEVCEKALFTGQVFVATKRFSHLTVAVR